MCSVNFCFLSRSGASKCSPTIPFRFFFRSLLLVEILPIVTRNRATGASYKRHAFADAIKCFRFVFVFRRVLSNVHPIVMSPA